VSAKLLFDPDKKELTVKSVLTSPNPRTFSPAFGKLSHGIITLLAKGPNYPANIARQLNTHHQTVYYHMHRLEKSGLVRKVSGEKIRGGEANMYVLSTDGYAVEFEVREHLLPTIYSASRSTVLESFFREFVSGGELDGWIVVGSPEPHGPSKTQGRDGHYAVQLGFALGQFVRLPKAFPVKLDVDVKNEKLEGSNLLLVGGPRTNMLSAEVTRFLPVQFKEGSFWGTIVDSQGNQYGTEFDAIITKVKNPFNDSKYCFLAAGLSGAATKAAIIGLTNHSVKVLDGYEGGAFSCVVRGVDLDGDGKVDNVEVLRRE
jgi:DNA-binding PadR family transcriptional regulator